MAKYRVERKFFFQNRLFDPNVQPVVNLNLDPKSAPRHLTCLDKPKKSSAKGLDQQGSGQEQGDKQGDNPEGSNQ